MSNVRPGMSKKQAFEGKDARIDRQFAHLFARKLAVLKSEPRLEFYNASGLSPQCAPEVRTKDECIVIAVIERQQVQSVERVKEISPQL